MNWRTLIYGVLALLLVLTVIAVSLVFSGSSPKAKDLTSCVHLNETRTCHSSNPTPYRLYGTKTAYHVSLKNSSNDHFHFEGCDPMAFYLFSRHSTRYPDREDILDMISTLPALREKIINASLLEKSNLCQLDIRRFQSWNMTLEPENDNRLSKSGKREAHDLAERYRTRFPELLSAGATPPRDIAFEHTSKERTESTAQAFAEGLFGANWFLYYSSNTNDEVLQFHKTCKKLNKKCGLEEKPEEVKNFENGPFKKLLVESVSKRLGFETSYDEIMMMYTMCTFSYALEVDDIWCSVFSISDLKILEYEGDVDDYYKDAYGEKLNYEQACPVINYLVDFLRFSIQNNRKRALLQFSHAGAIKKVYSRLGLFNDSSPLTAENLCSRTNRRWKSSLIAPFNSNIAIVLYRCDAIYKIAAFLNEFPVTLGGCSDVLCSTEEFFRTYDEISRNCNIKGLCCSCCVS